MTLLLAARHAEGGWTLGADSIALDALAEFVSAPTKKIMPLPSHPGAYVAISGDRGVGAFYRDSLPAGADLFSAAFQTRHMRAMMQEYAGDDKEERQKAHSTLFIAQGARLMVVHSDGSSFEIDGDYHAQGMGDGLATYFLRRDLKLGMRLIDAERLLTFIFEQAATVVPLIAPPWQVVSTGVTV